MFGYENQIDQTHVHIDDFPPEYYAQQAYEEELLRQEPDESLKGDQKPVESGDKKPDEPMDDTATESKPVETPEKSVSFAETIAEYKEYVPESDTPKRRRRKKHAIQEFAEVITGDGGESGIPPAESEQRFVELNELDEQSVASPQEESIAEHESIESIVPLVEDGPPNIEDVPEGTTDSPPTSPKKSRRRSRK